MRDSLRKILGGLGAALFVLGALSTSALALTIPATWPPRQFNTQQTHYIRFTFAFNSCALTLFGGTTAGPNQTALCSVKVGALPYDAFLVRAYQQTTTAFNSGTTDSISIGVTQNSNGTLLIGTSSIFARTTTVQIVNSQPGALAIVSSSIGQLATGNNVAQSGAAGGFDIFAQYSQSGTAPTAGQVTLILEYIAPNDGSCITVPETGATTSSPNQLAPC